MAEFFLLTGITPDQTNDPKRRVSVSFGDANASLGLSNWMAALYQELEVYSTESAGTNNLFSGSVHCQTHSMPLTFHSKSVHFDSTGLIHIPGIWYNAKVKIQHPNLPWEITEDIFLSARLNDEPLRFTYTSENPDSPTSIYPNENWLGISKEFNIVCSDTLRPHGTWPGSFGSMPLEFKTNFSEYSKTNPRSFENDLLLLKTEINGVAREYPYSGHYNEPKILMPSLYDIYDLDEDGTMWDEFVTQLHGLKKNQRTGLKTRMKEYQTVIKIVSKLAENCGECIHCRIHDELEGNDRSSTLYDWLFEDPDKIPNVLRPMAAIVLMIPSNVWKGNDPKLMPYYCWDIGKKEFFDTEQMSGEMSMARGGIYFGKNATKITPVRDDLPIKKTCFGYTSGTPIRMEFLVGEHKQKRMFVNWIGGLE